MRRDVTLYLGDKLTNMDDAMQYVVGMSFDQFAEDSRTSKAVIRSIEVMGEAVKSIPPEIRSMRAEIPWREMARMRDKCIHFYFGVDFEVVWNTTKDYMPLVRPMIQSLLDELQSPETEK